MKKVILAVSLLLFTGIIYAQEEQKKDTVNQLEEVLLYATRAKDKTPFAHSKIDKEELKSKNLAQDLPILIDQMPSVVTTSDAGAGVGYTGIRVRGSDATRVNVTLNGIPFNDSESQGSFWVDLPDFVSSVEDIQLQRGVGTSTNGSGAFGASLNLKTLEPSKTGYAKTTHTYGSFNTHKHNISIGSGIHNGFYAEGRLSKIDSDGYIDRAYADLFSHYLEAGFKSSTTSVKAIVFGGKEQTYQSWYGTPEAVVNGDMAGIEAFIARNYPSDADAENLRTAGRTYNYYLYDNEIDHYTQNHYQLHLSHKFTRRLNATLSYNFTHGKGYYEQYKEGENYKDDYFPYSVEEDVEGDVIRRKWLDNDFHAFVYSLNYKNNRLDLSVGGGYNWYVGDHFGEIIWDTFSLDVPVRTRYYDNTGNKTDANLYAKAMYKFNPSLYVFGDLQFRQVMYDASGLSSDLTNIDTDNKYGFFNPKLGLTYKLDNYNQLYASFAIANREPNRDDLIKNPVQPKPERLLDWEAGYKLKEEKYFLNANLYYMDYKDQLVLTGALDDVGGAIRENVAKSYRAGIELQGGYTFSKYIALNTNITISSNKIKAYDYLVYDKQYDPNSGATVSYEAISTHYENTDISYSPNVIAGATLTSKPLNDLSLSLIGKYVGKQYLDNTSSDNKSMDGYSVINFNASYDLKPGWVKGLSFNLLVNNLFNTMYSSNGYTFSYYYRPVGSGDPAVTENFYYPQAGINYLLGIEMTF